MLGVKVGEEGALATQFGGTVGTGEGVLVGVEVVGVGGTAAEKGGTEVALEKGEVLRVHVRF